VTYSTLISTEVLTGHLKEPAWVIVDCRADLADRGAGRRKYETAHIPGAIYLNLEFDLADPKTGRTGRHPLPDMTLFQERLGRWGIATASQVVAYDDSGGGFAARLWWMLRVLGHETVAVLDGGYPRWEQEGRPRRGGVETRPRARFTGKVNRDWQVSLTELETLRQNPEFKLIDSRAPDRFRGEVEPVDPVAGHIPGAINYFYKNSLAEDGLFLPGPQLRPKLGGLLGETPPERTVFYCGSGVTACVNILAMEHAGLKGSRLFVGSWSEWITDSRRPIARGE
jgi:thiosulfate/3-mercaptopyruvate sulfurtransferase